MPKPDVLKRRYRSPAIYGISRAPRHIYRYHKQKKLMEQKGVQMSGEGILDVLQFLEKAKLAVKTGKDLLTGSVATGIVNAYQDKFVKNPFAQDKRVGEFHSFLTHEWGNAPVIANYAGPFTQVLFRLRNSHMPVDISRSGDWSKSLDAQAMKHDILYSLLPKNAPLNRVQIVDKIFIEGVKNSNQPELLKRGIIKLFQLKRFGENIGLVNNSTIGISSMRKPSPEEEKLLREKLHFVNKKLGLPINHGLGEIFVGGRKEKSIINLVFDRRLSKKQASQREREKFTSKLTKRELFDIHPEPKPEVAEKQILGLEAILGSKSLGLPVTIKEDQFGKGLDALPIQKLLKLAKTIKRKPIKKVKIKRGGRYGGRIGKRGGQLGLIAGLVASEVIPLIIKAIRKKKKKKGKKK